MTFLLVACSTSATQGLAGVLPSAPESETTGASPSHGSETDALDRQIDSLKGLLASTADLTIGTIVPVTDLDAADRRAAEYRARVDGMRRFLYLPDPKPDDAVGRTLVGFRDRWSGLARALLDGDVPSAPVPASDWARLASGFSTLHCGSRTPASAPDGGMPLGGWAWACLSDRFFHELAVLEVGVNSAMNARRHALTDPVERAMRAAELRLAAAHSTLADSPSPQLVLRGVSWALVQVWRQLTELRLRELEAERLAGATPAFRWLLGLSPVVTRQATADTVPIVARAGTSLTASLETVSSELVVSMPVHTRLARTLHRIHYRLTMLEVEGGRNDRRQAVEIERARTLTAIAAQAR